MMVNDNTIIREKEGAARQPSLIKFPWDLEVYKRAYTVSLIIHKTTLEFPKIEQYSLANQLRRASKSICANIGEGFIKQKYSKVEFARFISIAEGSSTEVRIWLRYALDLGYISKHQFDNWDNEYTAISAMLAKLHISLKKHV